jgi:hypothetical protein
MLGLIVYANILSTTHSSHSALQVPHFAYSMVVTKPKAYAYHARRRKAANTMVAEREHRQKTEMVATLVTKKETVIKKPAPPKVSEAVALKFTDAQGKPIDGANVNVEVYDSNNTLLSTTPLKTGESQPGTVWFKAPKLPCVVVAKVADGEQWEIANPDTTVYSLTGQEGDVKSRTASLISRQLDAEVSLNRPYSEFDFRTDPQASIFFADDKIADTGGDGAADVKLQPKVPANQPATFYLQKSSGPFVFDSEANIPSVKPDVPNTVTPAPFALRSVSDVEITNYPDDSEQMITGAQIESTYGKKHEKAKSLADDPDSGAEWWTYPKDGLSFRMRKVLDEKGKPEELVERVRMTSAAAGKIGPIQVGISNDDLQKAVGSGQPDGTSATITTYLDGGIAVHEGGSNVDWVEIRRPAELLKTGVLMTPTKGRTRIFIQIDKGEEGFGDEVKNQFQDLPGLQMVNSQSDADLVVHVSEDDFQSKKDSLLGVVPMSYKAECKLSYSILDTLTNAPAKDIDGQTIDTSPVDVTAHADYSKDVEGGALLLALVGVAGFTIRNPVERVLVLSLVGGSAKVATDRMKDTMNRAVPRTNQLAVVEALDPVFRAVEKATVFRARVTTISLSDKTLTINAGSDDGVTDGMEFALLNEALPAFNNTQGPLKSDLIVARVTDVQSDHAVCKLFRVKHSVNKKAYEDSSETAYDEGLTGILDPSTGLSNARVILRPKEAGK